jgi:hypothetical protein
MEPRYRTPRELVEALHGRAAGARAQFGHLLREPLARLLGQFLARHGLEEDRALLTLHALHAAETYLRTRPPAAFAGTSWAAFRGAVLLHVAKVAFQPYGGQTGPHGAPLPLPESPLYDSRTFFRPYERLGNHWFGGDWFAGRLAPDGCLWVVLADITGHGYFAYLLACGLPFVWQRAWATLGSERPQPAEVLTAMHHLLADCLPEGVFVEAALARLAPDGTVTVAPAGGTRLLLRRGRSARPAVLTLRGMWLGLRPPSVDDQGSWVLGHDDELLLASDGIFDQLADHGGAEAVLLTDAGATLFDAVHERLHHALARGPQKDDLTMVLLRRRARVEGAGDVPV